jgi:hypothetical protein
VVVLVIDGTGKDGKANYGVTEVEGKFYYQEPEWDDVLYPAPDYPYSEALRPVRLLGFVLPCCGQKVLHLCSSVFLLTLELFLTI